MDRETVKEYLLGKGFVEESTLINSDVIELKLETIMVRLTDVALFEYNIYQSVGYQGMYYYDNLFIENNKLYMKRVVFK